MNVTAFYFGDIMIQDEIKSLEGEEWKDIEGYEGRYAISSFGRVACSGKGRWKIIKTTISAKGYEVVSLYKEKKNRSFQVHKLVANAFIPKVDGKNEIHHIDENKLNNRVSNLVRMDRNEHMKVHYVHGSNAYNTLVNRNKYVNPKKVYQFYKDGEYIGCFENAKEASDFTGVCQRNILQVANRDEYRPGKRRYTAGGYIWSFDKEIDLGRWYDGCTL